MALFSNLVDEDAAVVAEVEAAIEVATEAMAMARVAEEVAVVVAEDKISALKTSSKATVTMNMLVSPSHNRWLNVIKKRTLFLMTRTTPRCDEAQNLRSALSLKRADGLAEGAVRCRKLV